MSEPNIMLVELNKIATDKEHQTRRWGLSSERVTEYADLMKQGTKFPPVIVFVEDGVYYLADGFHRVAAAEKNKVKTIQAEVREGGKRAAWLYSRGPANRDHGLPLTRDDKNKRVEELLADPECKDWSDRQIAEWCGVSHTFVSKKRKEVEEKAVAAELEEWTEKVWKPWAESFGDKIAYVVKNEHILALTQCDRLSKDFAMNTSRFTLKGDWRWIHLVKMDEAYCGALMEAGLQFVPVSVKEQPEQVARLIEMMINSKQPLNEWQPIPFPMLPGDLVAHDQRAYEVVSVGAGVIELKRPGYSWLAKVHWNEIQPVETVRPRLGELWQRYGGDLGGTNWVEGYRAYKRYYCPDALLLFTEDNHYVALEQDAVIADELFNAEQQQALFLPQIELPFVKSRGAALVCSIDEAALQTLCQRYPIAVVRQGYSSNQFSNFYTRIVAAATNAAISGQTFDIPVHEPPQQISNVDTNPLALIWHRLQEIQGYIDQLDEAEDEDLIAQLMISLETMKQTVATSPVGQQLLLLEVTD
jgi:hypothetical protein